MCPTVTFLPACLLCACQAKPPRQSGRSNQCVCISRFPHWPSFPNLVLPMPGQPEPHRSTHATPTYLAHYKARRLLVYKKCHVLHRQRSTPDPEKAKTVQSAHRSPNQLAPAPPYARCDAALSWSRRNAILPVAPRSGLRRGSEIQPSAQFRATRPRPDVRPGHRQPPLPDILRFFPIPSRHATRSPQTLLTPPLSQSVARRFFDPLLGLCRGGLGPALGKACREGCLLRTRRHVSPTL